MKIFIKKMVSNFVNFVKRNRYFGITLLFVLIVGIGTLSINWSMVDDGKSAEVSQRLTNSFINLDASGFISNLLEPEYGRFRPLYWIYLWFTFLIFDSSSFLHHLFHLSLFILSCFVIYRIGTDLFKEKFVGIIASLIFAVDSFSLENWYRLGPQEPMVALLLLLSFVLYKKFMTNRNIKSLVLSDVLIVVAFLFKETVIAYVVVLLSLTVISYITEKDRNLVKVKLINSLLMALIIIGIRFLTTGIYPTSGYASLYVFNISTMVDNFKLFSDMIFRGYSPFVSILLVSFLIRIVFFIVKKGFTFTIKRYYWNIFFLSWFFCFLAIQTPWSFAFGRYLQVSFVGLFIFMAAEFSNLLTDINWLLAENTKKLKRLDVLASLLISKVILFALFFVIITYHLVVDMNYIVWVKSISDFDGSMMTSLLNYAKSGRKVYLNADYREGPLEIYYGIGWHIKYIYKIDNFIFDYVNVDSQFEKGDLVLMHGEKPMIDEKAIKFKHKMSSVLNNAVTIDTINPFVPNVLLRMIPAKIIDFSVEGGKHSNFYSTSSYTYEWKIYEK